MLCYALSRTSLARCWNAVKAFAIPLAFVFVSLTLAQSSKPQPEPQVSSSQSTISIRKRLSPEEQVWCPVLKSAFSGAASVEPPMRSYLLDAVAGGLGKCAPQKGRNALLDSFTATLEIPETQEEVDQRERRFFRNGEQPDEATQESRFNLQMKQTLQRSALSHLLAVDEAKVDSLLAQAEPDVRAGLMHQMISQATSAKKFDRALELLSRAPSKEWFSSEGFPFREATQLMLDLPPDREKDKQELFRVAMAADREQRIFTTSGDDLASMIVRFWRHVPPALALEAIHQVLDKAHFKRSLTVNTASGTVGFSNEHDYRVFELLPILRELDNDEADKLLQSSQQAQLGLKQFPNGMQSIDPSIGDTLPKGEPVHNLGPSIADTGVSVGYGPDPRVRETVRIAEDNPRQAITAAATLPETVGSPDWAFEFPRAEAYLGIARALMKKNPSVAGDALAQMAESLNHIAHPYQAMGQWLEGITIAREIDELDLALNLFRLGMEQADRLRSEDANPDDPNIAIKAFWPSVCAYSGLILAVSQISPQTALERVREIKDPEILLLLEIKLASKKLGTRDFHSSTMVHKKSSHGGMFGGCAD
jgi:hypothetical protein